MTKSKFLAANELIQRYPQIEHFNWGISEIGIFVDSKLLKTKSSENVSDLLIREDSFLNLIEYAEVIELMKMRLK